MDYYLDCIGSDDWGIGASCAITGCTDSTATNYDPTVDDGSCTYPCTDNVVVFTGYDSWGDGWNGGTYTITDAKRFSCWLQEV